MSTENTANDLQATLDNAKKCMGSQSTGEN
jgi:hypothetical protein